jgi:hypothetical protein
MMMNKNTSGSRGSTPPTPGNELDDEEHRKIQTMVTTPQVAKEKKKLMFKKVGFINYTFKMNF